MTDPRHPRWPAGELLWAVLESPVRCEAGLLPPGLQQACAEEMPTLEGELHTVCASLGDGRVLVCAAPRRALLALDAMTLTLTPAALPPFAAEAVDPQSLNLLVGLFEPAPIRRQRVRRHAVTMAAVVACAVLACAGLLRRGEAWRVRAQGARAAVQLVMGATVRDGASLEAELEVARREARFELRPPPDAAIALCSVLRAWPTSTAARPLNLAVGSETISMAVVLESDPAAFLKALVAPAGWRLEEPRLTTTQHITRLDLTLRRINAGAS